LPPNLYITYKHYIVLYCIILYYIILYYIILYCIILYYIVLYYIILYYIILHISIILYYIVLCYIVFSIVINLALCMRNSHHSVGKEECCRGLFRWYIPKFPAVWCWAPPGSLG